MTALRFVVLGHSITSSWDNWHAITYRRLLRALSARGHSVLFLERNVTAYADHRDLPEPDFCRTEIYASYEDLKQRFTGAVREADVVIMGSYVPQGATVGEWVVDTATGVTAFYDLDTPHTLLALATGQCEYMTKALVPRYQLYLSTTGGPALTHLQSAFGAVAARALYPSIDPELHSGNTRSDEPWDLGYVGTYCEDRQPALERLLIDSARRWAGGRFVVAGSKYPTSIVWPPNVARTNHPPLEQHSAFYRRQRFALNITGAGAAPAGHSPGIRLFEAAARGIPIISDHWPGLDAFFTPDQEILVARSSRDVLPWLVDMPESQRICIGARAQERVLREHSASQRAQQLESYVRAALRVEAAA